MSDQKNYNPICRRCGDEMSEICGNCWRLRAHHPQVAQVESRTKFKPTGLYGCSHCGNPASVDNINTYGKEPQKP